MKTVRASAFVASYSAAFAVSSSNEEVLDHFALSDPSGSPRALALGLALALAPRPSP